MVRGVIASPGIIKPLQNGFIIERSISQEELRYYILYWDKVVIPGNNLIYIKVPEEKELIECKVISRPIVQFKGSFYGNQITKALLLCQSIVAEKLVQDKKTTDWVLHQIGKSIMLPSGFISKQQVIRVTLANALPVPPKDVPIYEILEFKQKRRDELIELHNLLDELYFEVLNSPDKTLATKKVISNLKLAIQNLDRVSQESFKKTKKYDFSVELNINGKDIVSGAAAGVLIDFFSNGFKIPLATIAGALMSLIKIKTKMSCTFKPAKENTKLAYISSASRENILNISNLKDL